MNLKRGDVILVKFSKGVGSVQSNTRLAVCSQNNVGNKYSPTTIVVPFTSQCKTKIPTHVDVKMNYINNLKYDSTLLCEQIITIDKSQIIKITGYLTDEEMLQMDDALKISLGL